MASLQRRPDASSLAEEITKIEQATAEGDLEEFEVESSSFRFRVSGIISLCLSDPDYVVTDPIRDGSVDSATTG